MNTMLQAVANDGFGKILKAGGLFAQPKGPSRDGRCLLFPTHLTFVLLGLET